MSRTIVGKLLAKIKKKPTPTTTPLPPPLTGVEAENKLDKSRLSILEVINQFRQAVARLPYEALKPALTNRLDVLSGQINTLDTLPDVAAKAHRLMQVKEACGIFQTTDLKAATLKVEQFNKLASQLQQSLNVVKSSMTGLTVKASRERFDKQGNTLQQEIDAFKLGLSQTGAGDPSPLQLKITNLDNEVETTVKAITAALSDQKTLSTIPLGQFIQLLKTKHAIVKRDLATDVDETKQLSVQVQQLIDTEAWGKVKAKASLVKQACDSMTLRMNELSSVQAMPDGVGKWHKRVQIAHTRAKQTSQLAENHLNKAAFESLNIKLKAWVEQCTTNLLPVKFNPADSMYDGYYSTQDPKEREKAEAVYIEKLKGASEALQVLERDLRRSYDAYADYDEVRQSVIRQLDLLGKHPQASTIKTELADATTTKDNAHTEGPTQGWHRSRVKLLTLLNRCASIWQLADQVEAKAMFLPTITKKIEDKKLDAKYVDVAMKLLAEEGCSLEDAVAMAEEASGYEAKDGLSEIDASMSARTKHKLLANDKSLTPEKAHAIGKVVRCKGSAKAEDALVVATEMKGLPDEALQAFSKGNIETVVFRGAVTEVQTEDHDRYPRGWGEDQTWDNVPGMGCADKVLVGTMDDGKGGRKIPGPNEGPCRHNTPDLLGHEAGHTYDQMGGGAKRNNITFLKARTEDLELGKKGDAAGLTPGKAKDNYFMSNSETLEVWDPVTKKLIKQTNKNEISGQTQDAAHSETFAESFALFRVKNTTKWPSLMKFWANPPKSW